MLRVLACIGLMSSGLAMAQTAPITPAPMTPIAPTTPVAQTPAVTEVAPAPEGEPAKPAEADEPKMKKVCRMVDVVGSAIPRRICTMKAIKPARTSG